MPVAQYSSYVYKFPFKVAVQHSTWSRTRGCANSIMSNSQMHDDSSPGVPTGRYLILPSGYWMGQSLGSPFSISILPISSRSISNLFTKCVRSRQPTVQYCIYSIPSPLINISIRSVGSPKVWEGMVWEKKVFQNWPYLYCWLKPIRSIESELIRLDSLLRNKEKAGLTDT